MSFSLSSDLSPSTNGNRRYRLPFSVLNSGPAVGVRWTNIEESG